MINIRINTRQIIEKHRSIILFLIEIVGFKVQSFSSTEHFLHTGASLMVDSSLKVVRPNRDLEGIAPVYCL
jgi:hypothetical protein